MICGIYRITLRETGRVYVGQSMNVVQRFAEHRYRARVNRYPDNPLYVDMANRGAGAFDWEVLEECPSKKLTSREAFWIRKLGACGKDGYNQKVVRPRRKTTKTGAL